MPSFKLWISLGFYPADWLGHGFIIRLASDLLFCPIHKKLIIWEKVFWISSQTDNPGFSFIMYHCYICYWIEYMSRTYLAKSRNIWFWFLTYSVKRTLLIRCDTEVWVKMVCWLDSFPIVMIKESLLRNYGLVFGHCDLYYW